MHRARLIVGEPRGVERDALVSWLREDGHEIDLFEDPLALVGRIRQADGPRRDLLLWGFDLRDPRSTSWQEELRRAAADLPVILLSRAGWLATAGAAVRLGAVGILRHPIEPEVVRSVLHTSLGPRRS